MAGLRLVAATCAIGIAASGAASGQAFPTHPIRIVASAAGGGSDFMTRLIAQGLSPALGQSVIIDNRGGGSIPGEIVSKAAPDGHTLLYYGSAFWLSPLMRDHVPYDVARDFAPISLIISAPSMLVAHPSLPVSSAKELIALAKAKPGELTYGTTGIASSGHLAGELFKMMAGVDLVHVPYKGGAPAVTALLAGELAMGFNTIPTSLPQIKAGKLRALAVTTEKRSALLPDLPTVAESGLPGYEMSAWQGLMAPAGTPPAIVAKLHADATRAISLPDVREKLAALGVEVITSTPAEFANFLKADIAKYAKLVKSIDLKAD